MKHHFHFIINYDYAFVFFIHIFPCPKTYIYCLLSVMLRGMHTPIYYFLRKTDTYYLLFIHVKG